MAARRPYRYITPEELTEVALERFSALSASGKMTPIEDLARQFHRKEAVLSRMIVRAFRDGLVEIRPTEDFVPAQRRDGGLEESLARSFPGLRQAIVVRPTSRLESARAQADAVHREIGRAMARMLNQFAILRDGDVIGVGAGRGVYHTVDELTELPRMRIANVTIGSLTGSCHPIHHAGGRNLRLDADWHVGLLGPCFALEVNKMYYMNSPIFHVTHEEARDRVASSWLQRTLSINVAILGVGVLSKGHQFYEQVRRPRRDREPIFEPVLRELRSLADLSDAYSKGHYCPVADIAHRFFFVPPPAFIAVPVEVQGEIQRLLDDLNSRIHTISEEQLRRVTTVGLVAGTPAKAYAIRHLLSNSAYRVRYVCTDEITARIILTSNSRKSKGSKTAREPY